MLHSQNSKNVLLLNGSVATDATNSAQVDCLGFHYATFNIIMQAATNTSGIQKLTSLAIAEGDGADTSYTNVSGLIGTTNTTAVSTGTAQEFILTANVTTVTATNNKTRLHVDLRKRKRYLTVVSQTPSSNARLFAEVELTREDAVSTNAASAGFAVRAIV